MVAVSKGTIIQKDALKQGTKRDGNKWLYGSVASGYDKIQVWAENPEVGISGDLEIVEIVQVKISNRKYVTDDGTEKWAKDFAVQAKLTPVAGQIPEGFSQLSDESIPF